MKKTFLTLFLLMIFSIALTYKSSANSSVSFRKELDAGSSQENVLEQHSNFKLYSSEGGGYRQNYNY
ncbi:MAG: hypothetical protein GX221_06935 [Candidatus Riflebacteria bacterium]|nr:hypothetical protein [Candidatus Riflebacteria bacterium]